MRNPGVPLLCLAVALGCVSKRQPSSVAPQSPLRSRMPRPEDVAAGDILDAAMRNPRFISRRIDADGNVFFSKYGDYRLDEAEVALADIARPWTVEVILAAFSREQERGEETGRKEHLFRVLAASRDPRAAVLLGAHLDSPALNDRVVATYAIVDYFLPGISSGGTEQHMAAAQKWWTLNAERLKTEATEAASNPRMQADAERSDEGE